MNIQKITIVCLVIVIVVVGVFAFTYLQNQTEPINYFTAMEGKECADTYATDTNITAVLYSVRAVGEINNDGESTQWRYIYGNYSSEGEYITGFEIVVNSNGSRVFCEIERPITNNYISNWTIDSPEALEIAKENPEIKQWLNKYDAAKLETIVVTAGNESSIWYILWSDSGVIDDPHSAVIKLDANTGEVLYVEVQL